MGFLWFNAAPARIIMGDIGALALGSALSLLALTTNTQLLLLLICGINVMEAGSVALQMAVFKASGRTRRLFRMSPIHHHFELIGWPETTVIIRFWLIAAVCVAAALGIFIADFTRSSPMTSMAPTARRAACYGWPSLGAATASRALRRAGASTSSLADDPRSRRRATGGAAPSTLGRPSSSSWWSRPTIESWHGSSPRATPSCRHPACPKIIRVIRAAIGRRRVVTELELAYEWEQSATWWPATDAGGHRHRRQDHHHLLTAAMLALPAGAPWPPATPTCRSSRRSTSTSTCSSSSAPASAWRSPAPSVLMPRRG